MAHFQYVAYTQKYMKTMTMGMDVMQNSNGTPNTMNIMAQSKTTAWRVIWKEETSSSSIGCIYRAGIGIKS